MDGDTEGALLHYMQAAERGYEIAQSNVAYLLDTGTILTQGQNAWIEILIICDNRYPILQTHRLLWLDRVSKSKPKSGTGCAHLLVALCKPKQRGRTCQDGRLLFPRYWYARRL